MRRELHLEMRQRRERPRRAVRRRGCQCLWLRQVHPACVLGPRCGDGIQRTADPVEQCDDGKNDGSYNTCNPNCTLAYYCGDGILTAPEACDLGAQNSRTAYGLNKCDDNCKPAPYCGDKQVDAEFDEVCDDGINSGMPGSCSTDCKSFVPLTRAAMAWSKLQKSATRPPRALRPPAIRIVAFVVATAPRTPAKIATTGSTTAATGRAGFDCKFAGYCGDGVKQGPEQCDNGASNVDKKTAYGKNVCTSTCIWAPFCGDGRVHAPEECDGTADCDSSCRVTSVH